MTLGPWFEDVILLIKEDQAILVPKGETITLHEIEEGSKENGT
jgi:hypothetical protein